jgi:hypothetical protein
MNMWILNYVTKSKKENTSKEHCMYCNMAASLVTGKTNDFGIGIQYPNKLVAYGYDIHGSDSNGLVAKINFCPMCGRRLYNANL